MSLVRSNADIAEVKLAIKEQLLDSHWEGHEPSPVLNRLDSHLGDLSTDNSAQQSSSVWAPSNQNRVSIAHLTDIAPCRVPASPWTSIIADDDLVSNLVSVFLIWEHPFYNWIDVEAFINDMQAGYTDCFYCSAFLVNALLAAACPYSDYSLANSIHGGTSDLMLKLIEEAKRLLAADNEPTIPRLQGLCLLMAATGMTGSDGDGSELLKETIITYEQLVIRYDSVQSSTSAASPQKIMSRVLDQTCWGIFNNITMSLHAWQKPSDLIKPPKRQLPQPTADYLQWRPYPISAAIVPAHVKELSHYMSSLSLIVRDIGRFLYADYPKLALEEDNDLEHRVLDLHTRLLDWQESLPHYLFAYPNSSPSVLTHQ